MGNEAPRCLGLGLVLGAGTHSGLPGRQGRGPQPLCCRRHLAVHHTHQHHRHTLDSTITIHSREGEGDKELIIPGIQGRLLASPLNAVCETPNNPYTRSSGKETSEEWGVFSWRLANGLTSQPD